MPDWTILQWIDAGTAPMLALIVVGLYRIDRRLFRVELDLDHLQKSTDAK